jgi:hypothetical protein
MNCKVTFGAASPFIVFRTDQIYTKQTELIHNITDIIIAVMITGKDCA